MQKVNTAQSANHWRQNWKDIVGKGCGKTGISGNENIPMLQN